MKNNLVKSDKSFRLINFLKNYKYIIISISIFIVIVFIYNNYKPTYYSMEPYPTIKYFKNVFTPEECSKIIKHARSKLERSSVDYGDVLQYGEERTSSQYWMKTNELPFLEKVSLFVSEITGLPLENQEDWQVLRYKPGQQYKYHYDAASPFADGYEGVIKKNKQRGWGDRLYTFFIYLNNVKSGGEAHFPILDVKIKPMHGKAVLWNNLNKKQTSFHPMSIHGGLPVKEGEKWAINLWIRERPVTK